MIEIFILAILILNSIVSFMQDRKINKLEERLNEIQNRKTSNDK